MLPFSVFFLKISAEACLNDLLRTPNGPLTVTSLDVTSTLTFKFINYLPPAGTSNSSLVNIYFIRFFNLLLEFNNF